MTGFRNKKGFSLTELLVVVAIMGMFILVGIPSFSLMLKRYRLSTVTDNFASSLRLARQLSVSRQDGVGSGTPDGTPDTVTAVINATGNTFDVFYTGTTKSIRPTPDMPVGIRLVKVDTGGSGSEDYDSDYDDNSEFVFKDDGSIELPSGGNSVVFEMTLTSSLKRRGIVKMNSSGLIKVFYKDIDY